MAKNINKTAFDDATKLKLDIFGESFEEWLPVFNNDLYTKKVYVFDFFAGSGTDIENNYGDVDNVALMGIRFSNFGHYPNIKGYLKFGGKYRKKIRG